MGDPAGRAAQGRAARPRGGRARPRRDALRAGARQRDLSLPLPPCQRRAADRRLGAAAAAHAGGLAPPGAGEVVAFPRGAEGAHRVANPDDDEPARVLLVSTMRFPEVAEYPDTGATLTLTEPGAGKGFAGETAYMELFQEAMQRGAELDQRGTSTS